MLNFKFITLDCREILFEKFMRYFLHHKLVDLQHKQHRSLRVDSTGQCTRIYTVDTYRLLVHVPLSDFKRRLCVRLKKKEKQIFRINQLWRVKNAR